MAKPSYSDRDPRGWCGDPARGAALGRVDVRPVEPVRGRLTLRHVPIDRSGYDSLGTYWGVGSRLYWCASDDGELDITFRASDRDAAKDHVRGLYPDARFLR